MRRARRRAVQVVPVTGVADSPRPRWAPARCSVCGGRVRIDWGVLRNWTVCNSGCGASSTTRFLDGRPMHRIRVALAIPSWKWWTIHNEPTARLWSAWIYRLPARVLHRFGCHWRWRRAGDGRYCSWCGVRQL